MLTGESLSRRVLVVGLDCAPPALLFDRYRDAMPNLARLLDRGTYGPLRSTEPPITVPAWACMTSGYDPGELGLYGFRNRVEGSYELKVASARAVRPKRVWDRLGEAGRSVAALFVPLTWPPPPVRGHLVSGFLAPGQGAGYAFPPRFEVELEARFGPHCPDVSDFRTDDLEALLARLYASTRRRFDIARWVWQDKRPDFEMFVEMGTDRFHHAFWHHIDPEHPRFDPDGEHVDAGRAYYGFVDARLGELLEVVDDETTVLVVSDHGARPMLGGVRINEWLRQQGWLTLREEPKGCERFDVANVDWGQTRAWGEGGYYGRVMLNVAGREPEGIVDPARFEATRDELAAALEGLVGPDGAPLGTRVRRPEEAYRSARGFPPDLLAYFGDLDYRSLATVGGDEGVFASVNDTGPDACNHDWHGVFVMAGGGAPATGRIEGAQIYDVARTVLGLLGVEADEDMLGQDLSHPRAQIPR